MIALTIDVEDWYHIPFVTGSPFAKFRTVDEFFNEWKDGYDYLTGPTQKVLNLLDEFELKATFFVVGDITEHYSGLVEKIAARGHEIACHGLHHACKIDPKTKTALMTISEFEESTTKAKKLLENVTGQEVIGYRAPSCYISGWMLDSLEKLGFKYDSSVCVNSFYHKADSQLKGVDSRPYYPRSGALEPGIKRQFIEIPFPYFKFFLKFPTGGGPMLRFLGDNYILRGLKQSHQRGHTIFYFHPIDIAIEKFPGEYFIRRPYQWIRKGKAAEKYIINILMYIRSVVTNHTFHTTCRDLVREIEHNNTGQT